jgi:hypothetical protein
VARGVRALFLKTLPAPASFSAPFVNAGGGVRVSGVMQRVFAIAALMLAAAGPVAAQVGSTTDILTGIITGPDARPLAGAAVDATASDGAITRHAQTGANGRYTILFPDWGGQYRVTVRFLGMAPATFLLARQADEDRLVRNVALSPTTARLQEVRVTSRRRGAREGRATPGATGRGVSGDQALGAARAILTPAQWARVPERIRNPRR